MTSNRDATTTAIWPTFRYRDAPAAIRFLREAFGFEEVAVYPGEGEGIVAHAELRWPEGGAVMLGSHQNDDPGWEQGTGSGPVYVASRDIDTLYDRARRAGAQIVRPMTDKDYGSREFTARDTEGGLWIFGTYRGFTP